MVVVNTFSKRQKRLRGEISDVYIYDNLPTQLRAQIVHIWYDALGSDNDWHHARVGETYKGIVDIIRRELGVFRLPFSRSLNSIHPLEELVKYFLNEPDVEKALDVVELSFRCIEGITTEFLYMYRDNASQVAERAVAELNERFREHSVGYQYVEDEILRVDSEFLHAEVVKPALRLLNQEHYKGAQEEFLKAHQHYRHGKLKEALTQRPVT